MKTLSNVNLEIKSIIDSHQDKTKFTKKELKKAKADIKFLSEIRNYLETNPSESTILKQQSELKSRLKVISDRYPQWISNNTPKTSKPISEWNRMNNVPMLRRQLSNIKFILEQ